MTRPGASSTVMMLEAVKKSISTTAMENKSADRLADIYEFLPKEKHEFALSMLQQFKTKNNLSTKQWFWVNKLIGMAEKNMVVPDFTKD